MPGSAAWKIARIYHKKNNKRFIINAISLCFSFTILICICYVSISFNIRYKDMLNSEGTLLSCKIKTDNDECLNDINSLINSEKHVKDAIMYRISYIDYPEYRESRFKSIITYPTIEIDGVKYNYEAELRKEKKTSEKVFHFDKGSKFLLESEISYGKKNQKCLIYGDNHLDENSILINSKFCDYFNLDYNSVIGKKISYKFYKDKNNTVDLFENHVIKGVFNNDIYSIPSRSMLVQEEPPLFWLPFDDYDEINALDIFVESRTVNVIQFDNYSNFKTSISKYYNYEKKFHNDVSIEIPINYHLDVEIPELTRYYLDLDPLISISQYILFTISLFILFVGILSLFNVLVFISEKQIGFLDMCQAIGLPKKDRNKFTFMQNLMIIFPSIVVSILGSFILSIFITRKLNNYIRLVGIYSNIKIFSMNYYFIVMIFFLIASTLLIIIISLLIDKCLSKFKKNRRTV